ncbi:MAG: double-stranded beta-helix domain protein [halophilic archaeon J07HX5]|jgi:Cupin domain.|nr:MAG: double-stranded beta-helix domain protein [halophilic archaeon J07HX5]
MPASNAKTEQETLETSFGEQFRFETTAVDSDGELLRVETRLDPGVRRPLHTHPKQDETVVVQQGVLGLAIEDQEHTLEAGEKETVSAGTAHTFWNAGDQPVRVTTEHRPALRFEAFLRTMVRLDQADRLNEQGMPAHPLTGAAVLTEFSDEMRAEDVPGLVQRTVFPVLARLSGPLGYALPDHEQTQPNPSARERP